MSSDCISYVRIGDVESHDGDSGVWERRAFDRCARNSEKGGGDRVVYG